MYIVTRKHLKQAIDRYPDAANEIAAWAVIVEAVRWHNFPEVRSMFVDADHIHYAKTGANRQTGGHVYIRSFLTHKQYNNPANWDRKFGTK